jgi:hypothetical protein
MGKRCACKTALESVRGNLYEALRRERKYTLLRANLEWIYVLPFQDPRDLVLSCVEMLAL